MADFRASREVWNRQTRALCEDRGKPGTKRRPEAAEAASGRRFGCTAAYSVAAMMALMVCMRFSDSSKTMDCGPSKTSFVTSMLVRPNFS